MKIFLIGMPGVGKSTTGSQLAMISGLPFFDLDSAVEAAVGISIGEIFSAKGEAAFRQFEATTLRQFDKIDHGTIAVGGGTPCFHQNMNWMKEHGFTIYLKAPVDLLAFRLKNSGVLRPLFTGLDEDAALIHHLDDLLANREPYFMQADLLVQINDHTYQPAKEIWRYLGFAQNQPPPRSPDKGEP